MPHLASAAALLLALGTSASAFAHPQRTALLSPHHGAAVQTIAHHSAGHVQQAISSHHPRATRITATAAHPHHGRGRQIAQPVLSLREPHSHRASVERKHQKRSIRHAGGAIERAAYHPVPVVSLIRPSAEHPRLADLPDAVSEPLVLPQIYDARGRLMIPAALVGSHAILVHQNEMADQDGLGRVQNDADLDSKRARGMLVALPLSAGLAVDDRLPVNRRYARPWAANFLNDLARAHYAQFHTPLQVNSAVRTVEFQQHLLHINGNAAPAEGDTASPHLTGQAVDLAKRGMPLNEIAWMRGYLLPLIEAGKIDVEEEFKQSCFHISVYRRYTPQGAAPYHVASREGAAALASVLR